MAPLLTSLLPMASGLLGNLFAKSSFLSSAGFGNQDNIQSILSAALQRPQTPTQVVMRPVAPPTEVIQRLYVPQPAAAAPKSDFEKYIPILAIGAVALIALNRR